MSELLVELEHRQRGFSIVHNYTRLLLHNWPEESTNRERLEKSGKTHIAQALWSDEMLHEAVAAGLALVLERLRQKLPEAEASEIDGFIRLALGELIEDADVKIDDYIAEWRKPLERTPFGPCHGIGREIFRRLGVDATFEVPWGGRADDYTSFVLVNGPIIQSAVAFLPVLIKAWAEPQKAVAQPGQEKVDIPPNPKSRRPTQATKTNRPSPSLGSLSNPIFRDEPPAESTNPFGLKAMAYFGAWLLLTVLIVGVGLSGAGNGSRDKKVASPQGTGDISRRIADALASQDDKVANPQSSDAKRPEQVDPQREVTEPLPPWPLPRTGEYRSFLLAPAVAPLTITAAPGSIHFYCKLVVAGTNIPVSTVFIRAGETASLQMPLGNCELKYAIGSNWYGPDDLFGDETVYNKADETFSFTQLGNSIRGYTVELQARVGGNLETYPIPENQW